MSFDMWLTVGSGEAEASVADMNWLRNPFGLLPWLEANVGDPGRELYHALNDPAYGKCEVDRALVLRLAQDRWKKVEQMTSGIFRMPLDWDVGYGWTIRSLLYEGRLAPDAVKVVGAKGKQVSRFNPAGVVVYAEVDMDALSAVGGAHRILWRRNIGDLGEYQGWTAQLVRFAEQLQDPNVTYHASN